MTDSVLTYLDSYCERAGQTGLFAEPLNAITNLFFIAVGVAVLRALMRLPSAPVRARFDLWLLMLALFGIGVGSGLWHTIPTGTTVLMDVIPITIFINVYVIAALRRLLGLSWNKVVGLWFVYVAASIVAQKTLPPDLLNGTIMYIPTYVALVLITSALWLRERIIGRVFVGAVLLWSLALTFRTIDMEICSRFSFGTHFLWHTLNALVLWRLMRVLIRRTANMNKH